MASVEETGARVEESETGAAAWRRPETVGSGVREETRDLRRPLLLRHRDRVVPAGGQELKSPLFFPLFDMWAH
jgi:hypothetical protein